MLMKGEVVYREVFWLVLNPMMGATEGTQAFQFDSREVLEASYKADLVEPYIDEGDDLYGHKATKKYRKSFRKGSPYEWMNPLEEGEFTKPGIYGHGIHVRKEIISDIFNSQPYDGVGPI